MELIKDFAYYKKKKLKSKPFLRILNMLGMVSWKKDEYGDAIQYLRLCHPLSWVWLFVVLIVSVFSQGIPSTIKELKYVFKEETVIW